jgi:prepilin-type N-terminal cleavage/methylation domain-containing protein
MTTIENEKVPIRDLRRAFTLIELMIAMALATVVISALVSMLGITVSRWDREVSRWNRTHAARVLSEVVGTDLRALLLAAAPDTAVVALGSSSAGGVSFDELSFLSPIFDQEAALPGDIYSVQYHVETHQGRDGDTLGIYRGVRSPRDTYEDNGGVLPDWAPAASGSQAGSLVIAGISRFHVVLEVVDAKGGTSLVRAADSPIVYGRDGRVEWSTSSAENWLVAIQVQAEVLTRRGQALLGGGTGSSIVPATERYPFAIRIPVGD